MAERVRQDSIATELAALETTGDVMDVIRGASPRPKGDPKFSVVESRVDNDFRRDGGKEKANISRNDEKIA